MVPGEAGIRFEGVGFRYPGAPGWALSGIDLFIPRGQSLALVGQNGAGKTTFIKLLTRLYEPTEGRILLDGRDLRDWDERRAAPPLRRHLPGLQPVLLPPPRERGGGQRRAPGGRRPAGRRGRAGRGARAGGRPAAKGLDTQLGRWFQDGVELSGGQWQKVALARAFMRQEADILVLDEPTAALDAEAEHAVFQRFRALAEGRTTIVISHRFPTVRMADRIIGARERAASSSRAPTPSWWPPRGRYAHLFELQAQGYA